MPFRAAAVAITESATVNDNQQPNRNQRKETNCTASRNPFARLLIIVVISVHTHDVVGAAVLLLVLLSIGSITQQKEGRQASETL